MTAVALAGNSNVGKTTFFNNVTAADERVANWAGVTVDIVSKASPSGLNCEFYDLPGVYSLNCFSMEERTAKEFLQSGKAEAVFNIAECANLSRGLFLTLQLLEMGLDVKLLVNMIGEVKRKGGTVDLGRLQKILSVPVFAVDARNADDCAKVTLEALKSPGGSWSKECAADTAGRLKTARGRLPYLDGLPLEELLSVVSENIRGVKADPVYLALRLFQKDEEIFDFLKLSAEQLKRIGLLAKPYGDAANYLAELRYKYIDSFIGGVLKVPKPNLKKEKLFFGTLFSALAFTGILAAVFWLTFSRYGPGAFLASLIEKGFAALKSAITSGMSGAGLPEWFISFTGDAVIGGAGAVAKFLPQIILLFFFLNALEDTGYISRVAFMFDGFMSKVGLSGKSILTLLLGFGCNTSAVLVSKNLNNKCVQRRTLLLLPFVPCSAKTPVFLVILSLAAPLFTGMEFFVVFILYLFAILVVWLLSMVLFAFGAKQDKEEFVLELPPIRLPSVKRVLGSVLENTKSFLTRVAGIVFVCVILAWILMSFDFNFNYLGAAGMGNSILAQFGKTFTFLFKPLGISDWRICVALILGVTAKEVAAGALVLLFNGTGFGGSLDAHGVIILLVFVLLYIPCAATIAAVKNECGRGTAWLSAALNCGAAYFVCFVYGAFVKLFKFSVWAGLAAAAGTAAVGILLKLAILSRKSKCGAAESLS